MKNFKNTLGFSLLEMMMVVIIVGILAAIALQKYSTVVEVFDSREGEQILIVLLGAQKRGFLDQGAYTNNFADLDVEFQTQTDHFGVIGGGNIFDGTAAAPNDYLARVDHADGLYSLAIYRDGTLTCFNDNPDGFCQKMGYTNCLANNFCFKQ